ncbi:MAG: hypothetical protein ACN6OB_16030 [Chryseobacterium jejuense]|uniref:hypothetical protein n=1 Tax=Chryseobacterium jejuense TaxID=445960 RepID=UPI003D09DDCE
MKKIISSVILISLSIDGTLQAQVGINTSSPNSVMEVNKSLEGGTYRKDTSNTTITEKDYYITYYGPTAASIILPLASPSSFAISDLGLGAYNFNLSVEKNDEKTSLSVSFNNLPAGTIKNVTVWAFRKKLKFM